MRKIIIGIDDTDNLESRGTGHIARQLGLYLQNNDLALLKNITRHQLLVSPLIPYTSHNSSASLVIESNIEIDKIKANCINFLTKHSATGSDCGLCIAKVDKISQEVVEWGRSAKQEVLQMLDAYSLASKNGIILEGLTGYKTGIIGSLAAVGLRHEGNDGRILWLNGLREINGFYKASEIFNLLDIDIIVDESFNNIANDAVIELGEWVRPIVRNKKITLIVNKVENYENKYITASKDFIKSISE